MKNTRSEKGITLVALIITIIVLLILAVVAISAVSGDGILEHAKEATRQTSLAQAEEQAQIYLNEWKIQKHLNGGDFLEFLQEKVGEDNVKYEDGIYKLSINGQTVLLTENGVISQIASSATGGEEIEEGGTEIFTSSYTDEQGYIAFAQGLGFRVLTMEEYKSNEGYGSTEYEKIALPYGVTSEEVLQYNVQNIPIMSVSELLIPNTMTNIPENMCSRI